MGLCGCAGVGTRDAAEGWAAARPVRHARHPTSRLRFAWAGTSTSKTSGLHMGNPSERPGGGPRGKPSVSHLRLQRCCGERPVLSDASAGKACRCGRVSPCGGSWTLSDCPLALRGLSPAVFSGPVPGRGRLSFAPSLCTERDPRLADLVPTGAAAEPCARAAPPGQRRGRAGGWCQAGHPGLWARPQVAEGRASRSQCLLCLHPGAVGLGPKQPERHLLPCHCTGPPRAVGRACGSEKLQACEGLLHVSPLQNRHGKGCWSDAPCWPSAAFSCFWLCPGSWPQLLQPPVPGGTDHVIPASESAASLISTGTDRCSPDAGSEGQKG